MTVNNQSPLTKEQITKVRNELTKRGRIICASTVILSLFILFLAWLTGNFARGAISYSVTFGTCIPFLLCVFIYFNKFLLSFKPLGIDVLREKNTVALVIASQIFALVSIFASMFFAAGFGDSSCEMNIGNAMYLSVLTLTTVGYGDCHPIDWVGKITSGIEAVIGYTTLGVLVSALSDIFQSRRQH